MYRSWLTTSLMSEHQELRASAFGRTGLLEIIEGSETNMHDIVSTANSQLQPHQLHHKRSQTGEHLADHCYVGDHKALSIAEKRLNKVDTYIHTTSGYEVLRKDNVIRLFPSALLPDRCI
ncbi:hypothetical protein AFLA70_121g002852 [Aspergillus flavus AF70]|nr:hypothetical protein AFLA70_121g002852 [Aspergillus flavus AF70]